MTLDDQIIRNDQIKTRQDSRCPSNAVAVKVGDTVRLKNKHHKHQASDIYLVTNKEKENVSVQKIIHPLKGDQTKLMGKVYNTKEKLLRPIHRPSIVSDIFDDEQIKHTTSATTARERWSPFNKEFYEQDDSDDDEERAIKSSFNMEKNDVPQGSGVFAEDNIDIEWDDAPELISLVGTEQEHIEDAGVKEGHYS